MKDKVVKKKLNYLDEYDYFDKPLCFTCSFDDDPQMYLAYWTFEGDCLDEYVYFPLSEDELEELELGLLTRRDFFSLCHKKTMLVDSDRLISQTGTKLSLVEMSFDEVFNFYNYNDHFPVGDSLLID